MAIEFDWDSEKNEFNLSKHRLTFEEAILIWSRPNELVIIEDTRRYNEDRFIAYGRLANGAVLVVVHTYRDEIVWIISARMAESKERKRYLEKLHRPKR